MGPPSTPWNGEVGLLRPVGLAADEQNGWFDWFLGSDGTAKPESPTLVRVVKIGPDPCSPPCGDTAGTLMQAVVEVELARSFAALEGKAPWSVVSHYTLAVRTISASPHATNADGELQQSAWESSVPFAKTVRFYVSGLRSNTQYELEARAANAVGCSEGVRIQVLTPWGEAKEEDMIFYDAVEEELPACQPTVDSDKQAARIQCSQDSIPILSEGPTHLWISGFKVRERQLCPGFTAEDAERIVDEIQEGGASHAPMPRMQALRLALGMDLNAPAAIAKWQSIATWRQQHAMEEERARVVMQHFNSNGAALVSFPHQEEMAKNVISVNPCALVTASGCPVSVWHLGTLNRGNTGVLADASIKAWSRSVAEYVDVWLSAESDSTGELLGCIEVFDLEGVSLRQLISGSLIEKGKVALSAKEFYVENCYHVYVINASSLFSMIWKLLHPLISPRAAGKIVVDSGIPTDLLSKLGPQAAERLQAVLQSPAKGVAVPVLRPLQRSSPKAA